jgi:hypothetical protein
MAPALSPHVQYDLPGDADYQKQLYPPPEVIDPELKLATPEAVIAHFTASSLNADGIKIASDLPTVLNVDGTGKYRISFTAQSGFETAAQQFSVMHPAMLDDRHAGQAINGVKACASSAAWNPMAGYPVNTRDGNSQWRLFLPLGMPMVNHKAVTLLHYPPYVAMTNADYLNNMTLQRWERLLGCAGLTDPHLYYSLLDVNPIAAPGSGESEYPNDYFPIMLSSLFFDNDKNGCNYIRSMLELMLDPPHNEPNPYTLPLLVGGSPLYDPQAPGWFRVRYKDQLPRDGGIPQARVGQTGTVRIFPDSKKLTPYMIANHMIAAAVKGRCSNDPVDDIRRFEAQDLAAVSFLKQLAEDPTMTPAQAGLNANREWFGNDDGSGLPNPAPDRARIICINAQMDLFYKKYTWAQAATRCETLTNGTNNPCAAGCAPPPRS